MAHPDPNTIAAMEYLFTKVSGKPTRVEIVYTDFALRGPKKLEED